MTSQTPLPHTSATSSFVACNIASDALQLYGTVFPSRLLLGTARYTAPDVLQACVNQAQPAMLTASLRRQTATQSSASAIASNTPNGFWPLLQKMGVPILPNTAGCHSVQEAITTAHMARELFATPWIKLELIGDDYTLQPDMLQLIQAAEQLVRDGFWVLPYCTDDLVLCQRLLDVGCQALMPWAAPIGTGKGPINPYALRVLRDRIHAPLIVDAGLGLPSHACQVMEWGFDGVLLNTAVALAQNPVAMAQAFATATHAGHLAFLAGAMQPQEHAQASTPVLGTPFWHQK